MRPADVELENNFVSWCFGASHGDHFEILFLELEASCEIPPLVARTISLIKISDSDKLTLFLSQHQRRNAHLAIAVQTHESTD
jgi:hypothetical protein